MDQADWDTLVGDIYQAALEPERWPRLLLEIARPISAHAGQIAVISRKANHVLSNCLVGVPEQAEQQFVEMIERDEQPRAKALGQAGELQVLTDYAHTTERQIARSEFYQDYAIPDGYGYYGGMAIKSSEDYFVAIGAFRERKVGHLDGSEIEYLSRLGPHIKRSIELSLRLPAAGVAKGVEHALHHLSCAAFLVDCQLQIAAINASGERLIASNDGIHDRDGILLLTDPVANRRLRDEVLDATGLRYAPPRSGSAALHARRVSGKAAFEITVTPAVDPGQIRFAPGLCIVLVADPTEDFAISKSLLRNRFKLTEAEADVAIRLCNGATVREVAERRGTTLNTVRAQTKSVYRKTDTTHQSQLVAKVLRLCKAGNT